MNEEFSLQHDRNPIESMKSRLKSPSSIMNKMHKRGLPLDFPTMQANIMEVAGVRVICSFEEDEFFLAKCLKDQFIILWNKGLLLYQKLALQSRSEQILLLHRRL